LKSIHGEKQTGKANKPKKKRLLAVKLESSPYCKLESSPYCKTETEPLISQHEMQAIQVCKILEKPLFSASFMFLSGVFGQGKKVNQTVTYTLQQAPYD